MTKNMRTLGLGIIVLVISVSCNLLNTLTTAVSTEPPAPTPIYVVATLSSGAIQATEIPTLAVAPTVLVEGANLYQEDFSNPQSGWEILDTDYGSVGYEQGGYLVKSLIENEYMWGLGGKSFGDVQLDVDATVQQTVTDGNDAYGVDCRVQENGDGYGFRITSDGWVAISKYENTESSAVVDWFESSAIFTDGRSNHLTAICNGSQLKFLVNGIEVANAEDGTFTTGDIALSVLGFDTGTVSVLFDNLVAKQP
jgi:hypothetical protein